MDKLDIYVYQLHDSHKEMEQLDSDDEAVAACHWLLPTVQFDGIWESLIYDGNVKTSVIANEMSRHYVILVVIGNS